MLLVKVLEADIDTEREAKGNPSKTESEISWKFCCGCHNSTKFPRIAKTETNQRKYIINKYKKRI